MHARTCVRPSSGPATPRGTSTSGQREVPASALYGVQTVRARQNFPISGLRPLPAFVEAVGRPARAKLGWTDVARFASALMAHDPDVIVVGEHRLDVQDGAVLKADVANRQVFDRIGLVVPVRPLRDHRRGLVADVGEKLAVELRQMWQEVLATGQLGEARR